MILRRTLASLAFSCFLVACSDSARPTPATTNVAPDTAALRKAAQEFRVHYNQPVDLDSTDFYYQPVSVVPLKGESRILSSSSYESESNNTSGIEGICYNVVFFHKSTLEEHALLPHGRFVISEIDTDMKPDVRWPFLFYTLIKADTNADGYQDSDDASALFMSDRSGQQFRQLTPDGTRLESRQLLPKPHLLLVEVRPDTNQDHKYTHADGTYWLRFDLRNLNAPPVRQPGSALTAKLQQQMLTRQSRRP